MWQRRARWACLVLLLSACGDGGGGAKDFPPASKAGTRLRARAWVTDDGERWLDLDANGHQIWFDSQLGVPCIFQTTPNDLFACVPITTFGNPAQSLQPLLGYADAACTQRIAFGPIAAGGSAFQASRDGYCGGKAYAFVIDLQGMNVTPSIYEAGQPLLITTWFQRPLDADTCTAVPAPPGVQIVPLGSLVEWAGLVTGHVEPVATGHRLSYRQNVASDGTRERIGWYDTATKLDCTVQSSADGQARCVPAAEKAYFFTGTFGDAACTKPLVYVNDPSAVPPVVQPDGSSTGFPAGSYYRVGAAATVAYSTDSGACAVSDLVPTNFNVAEEMPIDTFDAFADVDLSPAGARLGLAARADAEGASDPAPGTTTDRTAQLPCELGPASDGRARCLPAASPRRYPDMTCASAPFVTPGADPSPHYARGWSGDFCTGGEILYEVGAPIAPPSDVYDTDAEGRGCTRDPFASGSTGVTFLTVGNPVPASSFAEAKLIVE